MPRQKLIVTAFALALAASLAPAFAGDLEDGRQLMADGRFDDALPKLQSAVKADPASADAALALAEVLTGLGRYEEAAKAAGTALKSHDGHGPLLLAKARAHMLQADTAARAGETGSMILGYAADCEAALKQFLNRTADDPDALVLLAKVRQHQGGPADALDVLMGVVKAHPDHFDANWEIAEHWYRQAAADNRNKEKWENAETYYRNAFRIDPTSGQSILKASFSAQWGGKPVDVLAKGYEQAASLLPGEASALKQLSAVLMSDAKARVAAFERLHAKAPDNLDVTLWYGYVLRTSGQATKAVELLSASAKEHSSNPIVLKQLGDTLMAAGNASEAVARYQESVAQRKGEFIESEYFALNSIARDTKSLTVEQREKIWSALWTAFPERLEAPNDAGLFYRDFARDANESVKWYLRAAEASPDDVPVLNDLGVVYHYNLGDMAKAEPYYRRAIAAAKDQEVEPTDSGYGMGYRDAMNNLAKILIAGKRWKELGEFAENDVPESYTARKAWLAAAKSKGE